jgi:hypothetical protein
MEAGGRFGGVVRSIVVVVVVVVVVVMVMGIIVVVSMDCLKKRGAVGCWVKGMVSFLGMGVNDNEEA